LKIDYAETASRHCLRPSQLTLGLPVSGSGSADDANPHLDEWIEELLACSYGRASRRKRAYVIINPHAGQGAADKIWETHARPIFEAARMTLAVARTGHPGEAVTLVERLDLDAYDIVVPCSGDGLPHEVFNGLAKRPDARAALAKTAICHIPCGSGNAMSCNLYGTHRPSLAALAVVKGIPTPLDLVSVTQGDRRTVSFLSQALGMIADLDITTEHLRWMGAQRFTYGFLRQVLKKKVYPCDIAVHVEIEDKESIKEHYRNEAKTILASASTREPALAKSNGNNTGGSLPGAPQENGAGEAEDMGLPPLRYGTVNDPLPDGWELVPHEKLGNFYCGNVCPPPPLQPGF
jgi:sphingosine kinase